MIKEPTVEEIIKIFEKNVDRQVVGLYRTKKGWLVDSRPKESRAFSVDPFYFMDIKTKEISPFNPSYDSKTYYEGMNSKPLYTNYMTDDEYEAEIMKAVEEICDNKE